MKEPSELRMPEDLRYSAEHLWVVPNRDQTKVGITDYAQDQLGEIVFVDLPEEGDTFDQGEEFGTIESLKTVSSLYLPVGGKVMAVNKALENIPTLVNKNPYEDGWLIEIKTSDPSEIQTLLTASGYLDTLK